MVTWIPETETFESACGEIEHWVCVRDPLGQVFSPRLHRSTVGVGSAPDVSCLLTCVLRDSDGGSMWHLGHLGWRAGLGFWFLASASLQAFYDQQIGTRSLCLSLLSLALR